MRRILVFDDIEREAARDVAEEMQYDKTQPLNECIEFGRTWCRDSYIRARIDYFVGRRERSVENSEATA